MLKRKECYCFHSNMCTSKRDEFWLVVKDKCQSSLYKTSLAAKECWIKKGKQAVQKKFLEHKLLLLEYKSSTEAKLEEARVRKENLLKSNEAFKQEMKQQAEETHKIMKQMIEMFQK